MTLSSKAHRYRESARKAMYSLNFRKAHGFATAAQEVHATEKGRRLLLLTSWLNEDL
jgi:hypothetical protein